MATHNPKESRATCESTLIYMYRGENHEHDIGTIVHLGGNLLSPDPILRTLSGVEVNLDQIVIELNSQAALHRGKGEELFKHYVVSLAPDEDLKDYQWLEFITAYMEALGYDNSTKWTAVEHKNTDCNHVHILACRVKNDKRGSLVSTYKDYELGWPVMREYEKKFGLRQIENPDKSFGLNKSKQQLKYGSKHGGIVLLDEAATIRAAFKKLYSENGRPVNMRALVLGLSKCGVDVKVSTNTENEISGISYRLKSGSGQWISGSKVKSTRFTWTALQNKEGISYDPRRDDPFLRRDDQVYEIYINIEKADAQSVMLFESNFRIQAQKFLIARFQRKQETDIEAILALVKVILILLKALFGIQLNQDDIEFLFGPSVYKSPYNNPRGSLDNELVKRVCERNSLPSDMLDDVEFNLNPKIMSVRDHHSQELSH